MATSYYSCDGTVSSFAGALRCSTGWQSYTPSSTQPLEFSGELITKAQTEQLLLAFLAFFTVIALYRALGRIFY